MPRASNNIVHMPPQSTRSGRSPLPSPTRPARERDLSRPLPSALSWSVLAAFSVSLALCAVVFDVPWWLIAWYGMLSIVACATYGADKSAARRGAARVSEQALLTLGLVGGWPGALVAQQVFRHKTRKRTFRRVFWATVVVNVIALAILVVALGSPEVGAGLVSLFDAL